MADISVNGEMLKVFELQKENHLNIRRTTHRERKTKLKRLLKVIYANSAEITDAVYADFKKPESEVKLTEIYPLIKEIKLAVKRLKEWMAPEPVYPPLSFIGSKNKIIYEPKGVALIIAPWNYPLLLTLNPLVSAVAAGNCVIIKPSEKTPNTSALIKKILSSVFDENEVAVFEGGKEISQQLLTFPFDHIFYTGGSEVGKIVMKKGAEKLSSVTLELGGKSPVIIDRSANLKEAAESVVWGKFLNGGQTCIAPDYLLVHKNDEEKIVNLIKDAVSKFYGNSNNIEKNKDYCRIINQHHFERIKNLIEDALQKGAQLVVGSQEELKDNFIPPVVLTNVNLNCDVMKEEIFGPVLPVLSYQNEEAIPNIVNANPKPLALYIFSKRKSFVEKMIANIPAGGVTVNGTIAHFTNSNLPFGGVNGSGIGKYHGYYGFKDFSNEKAFMKLPKYNALKIMHPPYTKLVKRMIDFSIRHL